MENTKIKICGITRLEDALAALEAGADLLGFNFYPKSPRHVAPESARAIVEALAQRGFDGSRGVGVFVDAPVGRIRETLDMCGLRVVQLHGGETPEDVAALAGYTRIRALKVRGPEIVEEMAQCAVEMFLADAPHPTLHGGSGQPYDYGLMAGAARRFKVFLAGGLTPANVADAVRLVRPYGVDTASGVESAPGVKDAAKLRAFCEAVRSA